MTIRLYTSWFSPFARKVALALELKGLNYEPIDGLRRDLHDELLKHNTRAEVPVLIDGDITVVNSADIVQYLESAYPTPSLYPAGLADRVSARALERLHDHRLDPIVVDTSYWHWADRDDQPPAGLLEVAQKDIDVVLTRLEQAIISRPKPWPFGAPGIVECAWFPTLVAVRPLGFKIDEARFGAVLEWLNAMRRHPVFKADGKRTAEFLKTLSSNNHERRKIVWSGDRIEWLMARGFHRWFLNEIESGRTTFPD